MNVHLTVCYWPKCTFWQVCSSDTLFVCLSGWKITHNSRTHWHFFTRFSTQLHLRLVQNPVAYWNQRSNTQVTRSLFRSIWIQEMDTDAENLSKCKLWHVRTPNAFPLNVQSLSVSFLKLYYLDLTTVNTQKEMARLHFLTYTGIYLHDVKQNVIVHNSHFVVYQA